MKTFIVCYRFDNQESGFKTDAKNFKEAFKNAEFFRLHQKRVENKKIEIISITEL